MDCLSEQEKKCLKLFKERVCKFLVGHKKKVTFRLYGSRVHGPSHEDSDIDVLTLVPYKDALVKNTIWDIAADIQMEHEISISPLIMTFEEFNSLLHRERLLAVTIQNEGIPL